MVQEKQLRVTVGFQFHLISRPVFVVILDATVHAPLLQLMKLRQRAVVPEDINQVYSLD